MKKQIIKWITQEELEFNKFKYSELPDKEFDDAIDALVQELIYKRYVICGDTHQRFAIPVFEGNKYLLLSMRAWGGIMADAMNMRKSDDRKYTYLDFYLNLYCPFQEKYSSHIIIE